jgi:tetratricopeptide (TPR) repeat protein
MLRQEMIRILAIALLATLQIGRADESSDRLTRAGIDAFTHAYQAWDADGFATAARYFQRAAERSPGDARIRYWQGTALFHRMLHYQNRQPPAEKQAAHAMDQAITALQVAVEINPRDAESHALLGTLYGMKIQDGLLRAIRYGPRVQEHQKQALAHAGNNPRVRYLLGTGQFHTAKSTAGVREALATLQQADKLFTAEAKRPAGPLDPRWGASSCLTFIGRAHLKLGDRQAAIASFRKALAAHPNDHIAKRELAKLTTAP